MLKKKMVERVVDNIMDNLYEYKDLVKQLVEDGIKKWNLAELKDFCGEE